MKVQLKKFTLFIFVVLSYSAAFGQENESHSILLKTTEGKTYFSSDNWKTLQLIDEPATLGKNAISLTLPNNAPENLLWQHSYEGISSNEDSSYSVPITLIQLQDGGYFCTSRTVNSQTRITKLKTDGTRDWTLYKGGKALPIYINSCVEQQEQILCKGWRFESAMYSHGGYVYTLDITLSGNVDTSYFNYSKQGWIEGNTTKGIVQTLSGYTSLGWIDSPADTDHFLLNYSYLDAQGCKIVDTTYDLWNNHTLISERAIVDNDGTTLFCVGRVYPYEPKVFNTSDIILLKIDTLGNILWSKQYGGEAELLQPREMLRISDGYFIIGQKYFLDPMGWGTFVMKVDNEGNRQWLKVHRTLNNTSPNAAAITTDGGCIIGGYVGDYTKTQSLFWTNDMYLLKVDANGDKLWDRTWGQESSEDMITAILEDKDRNIVVAGYTGGTDAITPVNARMYMAKLSEVSTTVHPDIQPTSALKVYPNPAHDNISVVLPSQSNEIEIMNTLGIVIAKLSTNDSRVTINLQQYHPGTYFIRANSSYTSFIVQ